MHSWPGFRGAALAMAESDLLILIPARMASTRLPGKPLADIAGQPMIVHVLRRAQEAALGPVVVATDSREIADAVEKAGGRAVMTRADHVSGSDRIFEALNTARPAGPRAASWSTCRATCRRLSPQDLRAALEPLADPAVDIATLAAEINEPERTDQSQCGEGGGLAGHARAAACARFISPAPPRRPATGRSITTSGFMPTGAPP